MYLCNVRRTHLYILCSDIFVHSYFPHFISHFSFPFPYRDEHAKECNAKCLNAIACSKVGEEDI